MDRSPGRDGAVGEAHAYDAVVGRAGATVILVVEVIVVDHESVEEPETTSTVVVELLADEDVVERFAEVLVNVGVVDVAGVPVLLEGLGRVEADVGATAGVPDQVARLFGEDVGGVAVLPVVDVAEHHDGRDGVLHHLGQQYPQCGGLSRAADGRESGAERCPMRSERVRILGIPALAVDPGRQLGLEVGDEHLDGRCVVAQRHLETQHRTGEAGDGDADGRCLRVAGAGRVQSNRVGESVDPPRCAEKQPFAHQRSADDAVTGGRVGDEIVGIGEFGSSQDFGHGIAVPEFLQADDVGLERGELTGHPDDLSPELRFGPRRLSRVHPPSGQVEVVQVEGRHTEPIEVHPCLPGLTANVTPPSADAARRRLVRPRRRSDPGWPRCPGRSWGAPRRP